jgi:hypothetical protein
LKVKPEKQITLNIRGSVAGWSSCFGVGVHQWQQDLLKFLLGVAVPFGIDERVCAHYVVRSQWHRTNENSLEERELCTQYGVVVLGKLPLAASWQPQAFPENLHEAPPQFLPRWLSL